ncbi:oligopeptide transport system substrate-binding protein [Salirhabdus euzebyi]|uniref:Oligopeptide transport system substrate-binding protein n=1 Tax=Salirhabdus euzebyi TaxID=394506 RepID=A0A841Q3Q2_9BACI|nr:peptide ABC transporter substrate-binding protein [Salirhabdus euzebyi]MBB6453041.1 oligopeptide transport system substrate-binding protein [Salirhabdus euzebyi]
MKKTKWSLLLVLGLVLSLFLAACSGGDDDAQEEPADNGDSTETPAETPEESDEPKVLNILDSSEIPTMDPAQAEDSVSIQYQDTVYEGLYRLGPGGEELVSGIAVKEDTEVSEDGLTWTFHLREDAKWSNGDPVTAHDFVYSWQRAIDPETASFYAPYLMNGVIKNAEEVNAGDLAVEELGVTAEDDYTLVVELAKATPYFESFAAFPTFYPLNQEFVEAQGENFALEVENLLFNGPFVMTEWAHEEKFVFEKNEQYWDAASVNLSGINVQVVKDTATAVGLYETGQIDRVGLSGDFIDKYQTSSEFISMPETVVFWLKFNQDSVTKGEYMQNENFRRAIAQAFDKQAFIDVVYGNSSVPADYFVPSGFVTHPETGEDFRAKYGDILTYDVDAAKEAWAAAKEELGFEEVEISFISGDSDIGTLITEFFKNELEKNLDGLTLTLKNLPFQERLEVTKAGEYELVFSGWGPDYMDAISFVDLWVTDGPNNEMGYGNAEYDKLVKSVKGELAMKPVERFEAMQEAEKIALDEVAIAPVFQRERALLSKPYVKGMEVLNPYGADYSYKYVDIQK